MVIGLGLLSVLCVLFGASSTSLQAGPPVYPSVRKTGVISTLIVNETQKTVSSQDNNTSLQMPFTLTSLSESFDSSITGNTTNDILGAFSIQSSGDIVFFALIQLSKFGTFSYPTLGPCAGNPLTSKQQSVWSIIDFEFTNLTGIQLSFSISRVYQDAALIPQVPQWILFGPGKSSYYAISNLNSTNTALQISIRRHNSSAPSPSKLFSLLLLATDQKCLNLGSDNSNKPGNIEQFDITTGNFEPDLVTHTFSTSIQPTSTVFVVLYPSDNSTLTGLDGAYSISASFVLSPTPEPAANHIGLAIGVTAAVLIIIILIVVGLQCYKKQKEDYSNIR
jgi:hypothetical protein